MTRRYVKHVAMVSHGVRINRYQVPGQHFISVQKNAELLIYKTYNVRSVYIGEAGQSNLIGNHSVFIGPTSSSTGVCTTTTTLYSKQSRWGMHSKGLLKTVLDGWSAVFEQAPASCVPRLVDLIWPCLTKHTLAGTFKTKVKKSSLFACAFS